MINTHITHFLSYVQGGEWLLSAKDPFFTSLFYSWAYIWKAVDSLPYLSERVWFHSALLNIWVRWQNQPVIITLTITLLNENERKDGFLEIYMPSCIMKPVMCFIAQGKMLARLFVENDTAKFCWKISQGRFLLAWFFSKQTSVQLCGYIKHQISLLFRKLLLGCFRGKNEGGEEVY